MQFLLINNPLKDAAITFSNRITEHLLLRGQQVFVLPEQSNCAQFEDVSMFSSETSHPDVVIVAGGDGTVLRHVELLIKLDAPILGVNFGRLGYLSTCEPDGAKACIDSILTGTCDTEERILFDGSIDSTDGESRRFSGLNEAVIYRAAHTRALHLELIINQNPISSFSADGILVATPTGSTAYNLSAGGPILMPSADNLVVTPICSRAVLTNVLVVSGTDRILIRVRLPGVGLDEEGDLPLLVLDGHQKFPIHHLDTISINKSTKALRFFRATTDSFLRILQKKMQSSVTD